MADEEDAFQFEAKIQRGNGTDDRDTFKAKVSANTIDALDEKVEQMRNKIEGWASEFRDIQPQEGRDLPDDQATLDGGEA
ncbi:hypothetical protein ACKVMT_06965 [Halobacteriales archaeon Cl-PHB]